MDLNIKEKEINGTTYYVRPFPPLEALGLLGDLQVIVSSGISKAVDEDRNNTNILDMNINLGSVIAGIGQNLKGSKLVEMAQRILHENYVSVKCADAKEPVRLDKTMFNKLFSGQLKTLFKVMYFVLEVNYADFFEDVPDLTGLLKKLQEK